MVKKKINLSNLKLNFMYTHNKRTFRQSSDIHERRLFFTNFNENCVRSTVPAVAGINIKSFNNLDNLDITGKAFSSTFFRVS